MEGEGDKERSDGGYKVSTPSLGWPPTPHSCFQILTHMSNHTSILFPILFSIRNVIFRGGLQAKKRHVTRCTFEREQSMMGYAEFHLQRRKMSLQRLNENKLIKIAGNSHY